MQEVHVESKTQKAAAELHKFWTYSWNCVLRSVELLWSCCLFFSPFFLSLEVKRKTEKVSNSNVLE